MNQSQAIDYLESTLSVPVVEMSRPMLRLLNAAARIMFRNHLDMVGYYDPEYSGPRVDLFKHLHFPARVTVVIPQSPRLQELTMPKYPDPWANSVAIFGI